VNRRFGVRKATYVPADLNKNMGAKDTKYVVITPVRDEEAYLGLTVESMVRQTSRPTEWVIVNDGSADNTGSLIDESARANPWICAVHRPNRGFRKAGGGVVEAFNDGYRAVTCQDWEFIIKLDGDLSFESDYFSECFKRFHQDPKLGIAGGTIFHIRDGKKQIEECPKFHVRGATKIYRRACWDAIGGFWPAPGWDTMDEVKANMLGWKTESFPDLHLLHHRYTGSAEGLWSGLVKNGRANYICGYHPLFMLLKCFRRLVYKPFLIGSIGLMYGFISGYLKRVPQVDDTQTIAYLRRQQLGRLLGKQTIWR
jgi:poly-beta-1,6-N-acetyl-D-glucosamine synthase